MPDDTPSDIPTLPVIPAPDDPTLPVIPAPDLPVLPDSPIPDVPVLPDTPVKPDTPPADSSQDTYANQVVLLVNQEREKAGLSPLSINTTAAGAAMVRAQETERSFSHTRPDGRSFSTALTDAGLTYRTSGENIAYGQRSASEVMNAWMNSSGHRANILNADFTEIGVAHYKNASGVDYWVQLFLH
ncbi:MAG: CAP domain-containing protein [Lachnospiraceae bacterium]|nr:CAP domain-containing protein [Lachnospiraceae bacterium]